MIFIIVTLIGVYHLPADDRYLLLLAELVNAVDVINKLLIARTRRLMLVYALVCFAVQSAVVLIRADYPVLFGH